MALPIIIQGGMGVGVSNWTLARAVSRTGQLGVVSGTALDMVLTGRLQLGDAGGHVRRALKHFPLQHWVKAILDAYFIPGGKSESQPFKRPPLFSIHPVSALVKLVVVANFVEVFLARESHEGIVGINLLEKIQLQTLSCLLGAMLAGVDYVLMGAGIPKSIPGILDKLANGEVVELKIDVQGAGKDEEYHAKLDPREFGLHPLKLKRPNFLPIISSAVLAMSLMRKSNGRVDGFVVEGPTAGGHNAPPRGGAERNARGEPVYGPKDLPEIEKIRALGVPFWLAGSFGEPSKLSEALDLGAAGVQVGTPFAFCEESGIEPALKTRVIENSCRGTVDVFTDPLASPTGFPFKVLQMPHTISEPELYEARDRVCDLGYLRQAYRKADGTVGYRCAGEPVEVFVAKGGKSDEATGRKCICNGLAATIGLAQSRPEGNKEKALVTAGDDVRKLSRYLKPGQSTYTAADVVRFILSDLSVGKIPATSMSTQRESK